MGATSGQYEIWKTSKDGGDAVQVTRAGGYASFESPDRKYIYYDKFSQPGLYRMPTQGGEEMKILDVPPEASFREFAVTSKGVYFQADATTIQLLDGATDKIRTIAKVDKLTKEMGFCVSPGDEYIVWPETDRNSRDLMLVEGFR